jgi:hypothetical protein
LTGNDARLFHEATAAALTHSLEMVSSDYLREQYARLGPVPENDADLSKQNQQMADTLFGQCGVASGAKIIETCLATATRADHLDSPFPLTPEQGAVWHRAQQSAYLYVIEMLCTDRLQRLALQFPVPADPAAADDDEPAPAPAM